MDAASIMRLFDGLYADVKPEEEFPLKRPLLAHYTSIQVLEKILQTDEVWFSNPLFMNDLEEVRFGILQGVPLVLGNNEIVSACVDKERANIFMNAFNHYNEAFGNEHVLDYYVFCLSEHKQTDQDGLLSMWRGYGANGNGVAIVFDTG